MQSNSNLAQASASHDTFAGQYSVEFISKGAMVKAKLGGGVVRGGGKVKQCKFCKRVKGCIPWRGSDGRQCRSCPRVIALDEDLRDRDRAELEEELEEGSDALAAYLLKLEAWETANPYSGRAAVVAQLALIYCCTITITTAYSAIAEATTLE
jgi:hypothetical protein